MFAVFRDFQKTPSPIPSLGGTLIPLEDGADVSAFSIEAGAPVTQALVLDGERTHVTIYAEPASRGSMYLDLAPAAPEAHCAVELFLGRGAELTVLFAQRATSATVRVVQRSRLEDGAKLHVQNVTIGGEQVTHDLVSTLEGPQAESSVDWAFYARGREKYALNARNVFNGRNGSGEILLKGVAEETATARCDGMIEIGEGGGGTQTYLTEDVLMLDSTAKVDAIPALEIRTNDVKASHSATVSRVSEAELFYFAARGIPQPQARRMYVQGFLADVLRSVDVPEWREAVEAALSEKYEHAA